MTLILSLDLQMAYFWHFEPLLELIWSWSKSINFLIRPLEATLELPAAIFVELEVFLVERSARLALTLLTD